MLKLTKVMKNNLTINSPQHPINKLIYLTAEGNSRKISLGIKNLDDITIIEHKSTLKDILDALVRGCYPSEARQLEIKLNNW